VFEGRNNTPTTLSHQQHTNLVRQLEIAINTGVIHKHMLNVPLIEPNIRVIHQLLQLCQTYQNSAESLGQVTNPTHFTVGCRCLFL